MTYIAFIGLGTMGLPMARNLIEGGHTVAGFDIDPTAVARHVAQGGRGGDSSAEAARSADVVITMLPNAPHVRAVLLDTDLPKTCLVIDMSTIHPLESDAIRAALQARGIPMIDAPVGRTSAHAAEGKLLVMAGGNPEHVARATPLFELLGDTLIDCGGPGKGIRTKIVNNFMSIALNALTAEALTLAEALDVDVQLAVEVMAGTPAGQGHMATTYPAKAFQGDFEPGFMLELAHKDLGLALDLAATCRVPVALGAAAREVYSVALNQGRGRQDWTALYATVRALAGLDSSAIDP